MTDHIERLQLDLDLRLREVWNFAFDMEFEDLESLGLLIRAAYGQGYVDAHTEVVPAQLYRDNGYALPKRAEFDPAKLEWRWPVDG